MSHTAANAPPSMKQSLAELHSGYEQFASLLEALFGDFERLRGELAVARAQLATQRAAGDQVASLPAELEQSLRFRIAELEQERLALEQELEQVRARAVEMAQTIADQKRQMADENTQWTTELRQLRRTLDKQAAWITQHAEQGPRREKRRRSTAPQKEGGASDPPTPSDDTGSVSHPVDERGTAAGPADVVLGSVLSQFELLQKDVARRRSQTGPHAESDGSEPARETPKPV